METNQQCSIAILSESQCHQTTYSKTVGIEHFDDLPSEDREIMMWRTGLSIIIPIQLLANITNMFI